jgi:hypothetical protein
MPGRRRRNRAITQKHGSKTLLIKINHEIRLEITEIRFLRGADGYRPEEHKKKTRKLDKYSIYFYIFN